MFNHVDIDLPKLERETIDGVRYYSVPDEDELIKLVSITSITSHFNKEIFINWRKKVGDEEANRITKAAALVIRFASSSPTFFRQLIKISLLKWLVIDVIETNLINSSSSGTE